MVLTGPGVTLSRFTESIELMKEMNEEILLKIEVLSILGNHHDNRFFL